MFKFFYIRARQHQRGAESIWNSFVFVTRSSDFNMVIIFFSR